MSIPDLNLRLTKAAAVAAPPRSIVEDVMRQVGSTRPDNLRRPHWRHPFIAASFAALGGLAAILAFVFFVTGPIRLTLADVENSVVRQRWVHIRYDAGQNKELWCNLQTGERYFADFDGTLGYINPSANTRLIYWKDSGVIQQSSLYVDATRETVPQWKPGSAWKEFVAPYEHLAATQPAGSHFAYAVAVKDTLNGVAMIRFDEYGTDAVGNRLVFAKIWADPNTHLPVRITNRLQLGDRERAGGREWSIGDFDFPSSGPADLYAMGVPTGTPIHVETTVTPDAIRPILAGINRNYDGFLKNYRAIIFTLNSFTNEPDEMDIIWRDGDIFRRDHHLPPYETQYQPIPPLPAPRSVPDPAAFLAWATRHEATEQNLIDSEHEYTLWREDPTKNSKPQVHVLPLQGKATLEMLGDPWLETLQWPMHFFGPGEYRVLPGNAESPSNCVGLRADSGGNRRSDYFIDPSNDYICVKRIDWSKRGGIWTKARQYTLSNLRRIANHVVAGTKTLEDYGDPALKTVKYTQTTTIDLVPMSGGEYPRGTFDAASFEKGAEIIGY
jgi:hypothetical protein